MFREVTMPLFVSISKYLELCNRYKDLSEMPDIWIVNVLSDAIERAGYDPEDSIMYLQFRGGKAKKVWYQYEGVPLSLWVKFSESSQKGEFVAHKIRKKFTSAKL